MEPPLAAEVRAGVLTALPFGRGRLFRAVRGKSLPDWSTDFAESWAQFFLKYLLGDERVTAVIPGTSDPGHMADNLGADPVVSTVTGDSRAVVPGAVFFALPGVKADGHAFAAEAARRGAVAVVAERAVECAPARLLLAPSARRDVPGEDECEGKARQGDGPGLAHRHPPTRKGALRLVDPIDVEVEDLVQAVGGDVQHRRHDRPDRRRRQQAPAPCLSGVRADGRRGRRGEAERGRDERERTGEIGQGPQARRFAQDSLTITIAAMAPAQR